MQDLSGSGWQAAAWSAVAMTLIVALRYLVTSGAFAWATRIVRPGLYQGLEPQIHRFVNIVLNALFLAVEDLPVEAGVN